jgi:hypothetical protein
VLTSVCLCFITYVQRLQQLLQQLRIAATTHTREAHEPTAHLAVAQLQDPDIRRELSLRGACECGMLGGADLKVRILHPFTFA